MRKLSPSSTRSNTLDAFFRNSVKVIVFIPFPLTKKLSECTVLYIIGQVSNPAKRLQSAVNEMAGRSHFQVRLDAAMDFEAVSTATGLATDQRKEIHPVTWNVAIHS